MRRMSKDQYQAGFSLFEMLVVLLILAVVTAVAIPRISASQVRQELRLEAAALKLALEDARIKAIRGSGSAAVSFDVERAVWWDWRGREKALKADTEIAVTVAESEVTSQRRGAVRFYLDGSSTGGVIVIRRGSQSVRIEVDWMTGRAHVVS